MGTACVNATFDNADTSLDVVLGWNGKAIYEKEFSFSNFTKDCANVPDIPDLKACVDFTNVTVNTSYVGCCVGLELDAFGKNSSRLMLAACISTLKPGLITAKAPSRLNIFLEA